MRKTIRALIVLCLAVAAARGAQPAFLSHVEDRRAAEKAAEMLEALGGRERWAALKSLYIRATHTEKNIPKPYRSEIWRNLDSAQVRVVQQNEDFYNERVVNKSRGWLIRRGETRELTAEQLADMLHWDAHLFYKTLRKIALGRRNLDLKLDGRGRLVVYEGGRRLAAMELDGLGRPHKYYVPSRKGEGEGLTVYREWGVSGGYVHPVVSEPQGEDAVYRADEWKPGRKRSAARFTPGGATP